MLEIGVHTTDSPGFLASRSTSSNGISSVRSLLPRSISATRLDASVTNLKITVSKAGLPPQ